MTCVIEAAENLQLVVVDGLEQRLGEGLQTLNLFRWRASILCSLVAFHGLYRIGEGLGDPEEELSSYLASRIIPQASMQDVRSSTAGHELVVSHQSIAQIRDLPEEFDLSRRRAVCLSLSEAAWRIYRSLEQLFTSFSLSLDCSFHGTTLAASPGQYRKSRMPARLFVRSHMLSPALPFEHQPVRAVRRAPWRHGWLPGLGR